MKKVLFLFYLNFIAYSTFSQNHDFSRIQLKDSSDYKKAETQVLIAVNYLLESPLYADERSAAHQFLFRWMDGTPFYAFDLDETATKIAEMNPNLMEVYLAALVKYTIENKEDVANQYSIKLNTVREIVAYCLKSENNVPIRGELKKLLKANEKGELEKYLEMAKL